MIEALYNTTFASSRMVTTSGGRYSVPSGIVLSEPCVIRPITETAKLFNQNNWGKEFMLFCSSSVDVKPNDGITSGGTSYTVQGVSSYQSLRGTDNGHLEINIFRP